MPDEKTAVHRALHLTTPLMHGDDVRELQNSINHIAKDKDDLGLEHVVVDAEYGKHTFDAAAAAAFAIGLKKLAKGVVDQKVQELMHDPSKRTKAQHAQAQKREKGLREAARHHAAGADAAIKWARTQVGVTEQPPGSNWGGKVEQWIKETGYSGPVFWCGCFAHHAVVLVGKAKIPNDNRLGYSGYIDADARSGANGLQAVAPTYAAKGDLVTFCFDGSGRSDHIATCTGPLQGGLIPTIDGNSSASDGTNNNGGEVAEHKRALGLVVTVARPSY